MIGTFAEAWDAAAENDLEIQEYRRRKSLIRRQLIVELSRRIGWHFLKYGESVPAYDYVLAGISLAKKSDFLFLDLLRLRREAWEGKDVFLFHVEKPYVLPLPCPVKETPVLAVFNANRPCVVFQGADARKFLGEGTPGF